MQNWKELVKLDLDLMLKRELKVSLSQHRHINKIINRYLEYVKNESGRQNLVNVLKEFIYLTKGKNAPDVRNIYRSLVTYNKNWGKNSDFVIRKKKDVNGACKVNKELWGRPRLFITSDWINQLNKQIINDANK